MSADANHTLVNRSRLWRVMQHAHQRSRISRLIYAASSSLEPFHTARASAAQVSKQKYAYLVVEKVRGKVKGTRKKREEVLPKAHGSMAGIKTHELPRPFKRRRDALVAQQGVPEPRDVGPYVRARHSAIV